MKKRKKTSVQTQKRSSKNLSIASRITITTALSILIPIIIVAALGSVFIYTMSSYFNMSSVTTNSYSILNIIQWSQTTSSISDELVSDDSDSEKLDKISEFVAPIEELGSSVYIEKNSKPFYSTESKSDIIATAQNITECNPNVNINYFGDNGLVIISHSKSNNDKYFFLITNENYSVKDITKRYSQQNFKAIIFGRTGIIISLIVLIFIISIVSMSLITSKVIKKPIKKLAEGANEIAGGNLGYVIDYESTNELGETVKAFNHMAKQLKQLTDERNEMEESKNEMIAGLAHDLRTPLTSAKGYVEGLIDGIANTPQKRKQYLETIYASTCDMERLLDDLLNVSRLESGKIILDCEDININDFLSDCAQDIKRTLDRENFDFEFDNRCEKDVVVELDTDRFERVINNIISNSLKYKRKNVKGKVILSAQSYKKSVIISIADNGTGLDAKSLPKIFDTFYRADKARSNVSDGSGIGLAVCRQIVELHGGHIWATGKENEGLTILISLERKA